MDRHRMELLLPARSRRNHVSPRRQESKNCILSEMITVSPLADKIPKHQLREIPSKPYNKVKNGKRYDNIKQERYQRLNRDSKLKMNEEWTEILQRKSELDHDVESEKLNNTATNLTPTPALKPDYFKSLHEANKQIDEAAMQLDEISKFIESKKNNIKRVKVKTPKKPAKDYVKLNKTHVCAKSIYQDKVNSIDSMMSYFDKHMKIDEDSMDSKRHNVSAKELKERKKKIESTLGQVNERLDKVKKKYFENDFKSTKLDPIVNRTKYHSIKEISDKDVEFDTTMEAWHHIKDAQQGDVGSTPYINQSKNMTQLYKNLQCSNTQTSYDDLSDKDEKEETFNYQQMLNDKQILSNDVSQIIQRYRPNSQILETKSVGLDTTPKRNTLHESILKSDYLRKEFDKKLLMVDQFDINDDTVIEESRDWSKELAFFMK